MNKFLKISIIVLVMVVVLIVGVTYWIFRPQVQVGSEIIPTQILMEQKSPNNEVTAQILEGERIERFNPLGSNKRFYLTFEYPNSRHLILRDLSDGLGSYEGGVLGFKWLDPNRVYIERVVCDQQADVIYDLSVKKMAGC